MISVNGNPTLFTYGPDGERVKKADGLGANAPTTWYLGSEAELLVDSVNPPGLLTSYVISGVVKTGNSISYEKGRGVPESEGVIKAAFDGNHGWFWRNRTATEVTITLRTRGAYSDIKRVM